MKRYSNYELLIIDEIGYLPMKPDDANLLFQLVNNSLTIGMSSIQQSSQLTYHYLDGEKFYIIRLRQKPFWIVWSISHILLKLQASHID